MISAHREVCRIPHEYSLLSRRNEYDLRALHELSRKDLIGYRGTPDFFNLEAQWYGVMQRKGDNVDYMSRERSNFIPTPPKQNKLLLITGI